MSCTYHGRSFFFSLGLLTFTAHHKQYTLCAGTILHIETTKIWGFFSTPKHRLVYGLAYIVQTLSSFWYSNKPFLWYHADWHWCLWNAADYSRNELILCDFPWGLHDYVPKVETSYRKVYRLITVTASSPNGIRFPLFMNTALLIKVWMKTCFLSCYVGVKSCACTDMCVIKAGQGLV